MTIPENKEIDISVLIITKLDLEMLISSGIIPVNPQQAYEKGLQSQHYDSTMRKFSRIFAVSVSQSPEISCLAGEKWPDHLWTETKQILIEGLVKDPALAVRAGVKWNDKRFMDARTEIYNAVIPTQLLTGYDTTLKAGIDWSQERFIPVEGRIVKKIAESTHHSFEALKEWPDHRFNKHYRRLSDVLDPNHRERKLGELTNERKTKVEQYLFYQESARGKTI